VFNQCCIKDEAMPKNKTQTSMLALVKEAKAACSNGDFEKAHTLYSSAIMLNDSNPVLYGNRSAVRATFGNAAGSIEDAKKAVQLDPSYVKVSCRIDTYCIESLFNTL